jgi:Zn-dependent metalloprotease
MNNHSIFCIIPPYMLNQIAVHGSQPQRATAIQTLRVTEQMRGLRQAAVSMPVVLSVPGGPGAAGAAAAAKMRTVYDAQNGSNLPGSVARQEGDPPVLDVAVNEAYDGCGETFDLYNDVYQRNSIDGNGMPLVSTVHYEVGYDNAFWDGSQMVYGDGDENLPVAQRLFNRFTISLDVIGHELTHGVTQFSAQLVYNQQPGALNESMSDVFGSLVRQHFLHQTAAQADWIIGAGLFTSNVNGVGIRSMKAPGTAYDDPVLGKDPQPAHMKDYVNTTNDNGGVHINSGIPNRAFYVTAVEIGGNAWEKAGLIWYIALTSKLTATSNFQTAANHTFTAAGERFGQGGLEQQAVKKGWAAVGIDAEKTDGGSTDNSCLGTLLRFLGAAPAR